MLNKIKTFWQEEEGMGTVEILMIVGVLVAIAVFFRTKIFAWVKDLTGQVDIPEGTDKTKVTP